ncbi:hypothetical protein LXL04_004911 [Taraxacum kok-saghyz]
MFKGLKKERADAGFFDEEEYNGSGNSPSIDRFEEDDQRQEAGDEMPDIYFYEDELIPLNMSIKFHGVVIVGSGEQKPNRKPKPH